MSLVKRKSFSAKRSLVPRRQISFSQPMRLYRSPYTLPIGQCRLVRTVEYVDSLFTSQGRGFGWSLSHLWVNQTSTTTIQGQQELSSLFDLYRIEKIECSIRCSQNSTEYGNPSGFSTVVLKYAVDYNDGNNATNSTLLEHGNFQVVQLDKIFRKTIYPGAPVDSSSGITN